MIAILKIVLGILAALAVHNKEYMLACVWILFMCAIVLEKISNQLADATKKGRP